MSKSDFPALRMVVENGRLVPAGQFDAERLSSYRRGAIVQCRFTEEKDRVLVKKWFAIIGLVLKTCNTPWKNKDEAHEAIKLALGIVNLSKTVGGQFMQYPKSLTDLEDPEMLEALEAMTELLSRMTGVDVETLRKETAHIQEEPDTHSGASSPDANDENTPPPSSLDAAGEGSPSPSPSPAATILDCAREMLTLACLKYDDLIERDAALSQSMEGWEAKLPDEQHGTDDIAVAVKAIIHNDPAKRRTVDQAREWLASRLKTTIEELSA